MAAVAALAGCQRQEHTSQTADRDYQKVLTERLLDAKPGEVIDIPAGTYAFDRSLNLRVDGVDSMIVDYAQTPPVFNENLMVEITP
jgi:hypothetical protein